MTDKQIAATLALARAHLYVASFVGFSEMWPSDSFLHFTHGPISEAYLWK